MVSTTANSLISIPYCLKDNSIWIFCEHLEHIFPYNFSLLVPTPGYSISTEPVLVRKCSLPMSTHTLTVTQPFTNPYAFPVCGGLEVRSLLEMRSLEVRTPYPEVRSPNPEMRTPDVRSAQKWYHCGQLMDVSLCI